jgi:p-hydroxybenzoate 3-monooxygenase
MRRISCRRPAKGLNLAASDVNYLWRILREYYHRGRTDLLASYSRFALDRVWKGERFSWFMTRLLHDFPQQSEFDKKCRRRTVAITLDRAPG